ncbi:MAG: 3-dehydroquinate synthase, partial [Mycobacterium leprae]
TVGRLLAQALGRPFVDTDAWIEAKAGRSIPEIFRAEGEAGFRAREVEAVAAVTAGSDLVIATGGGAVLNEANRAAMRQRGLVVWLDASPDELYRRAEAQGIAGRPLLAGEDPLARLRTLAENRAPAYAAAAHHRLVTDGITAEQAVAAILGLLGGGEPVMAENRGAAFQQVKVSLGERSYDILIGSGLLDQVGHLLKQRLGGVQRCLIITDSNVGPLYGDRVTRSLEMVGIHATVATFAAGEESKTLATAAGLYGDCVRAGLERSSAIVALGGGVVGDLAGFVAATYLRGIPFVQVPTTLLAQVDSSVGGKTGVDLPEGKNLVGAFHQPSLVVADPETLRSLPLRDVASGMGEVIKHGVIRDPAFLTYLEGHRAEIQALDGAILAEMVANNCRIKAAVVGEDERESNLRAILNFGHTAGHAVEAAMGFGGWRHGECVAVGMVAATRIAAAAGILQEPALLPRLVALLDSYGLPTALPPGLDPAGLLPLIQRDKKSEGGRVKWVMPVRPGEMSITAAVAPETVAQVLADLRR